MFIVNNKASKTMSYVFNVNTENRGSTCYKFKVNYKHNGTAFYMFKVNNNVEERGCYIYKVGGTVCYMSMMKFVEQYCMLNVQSQQQIQWNNGLPVQNQQQ